MMQTVHQGSHPGKSTVLFLPMIDMDPSDMSCILSTLNYVYDQAKYYKVAPVITFDQPLFWKAMLIIESEPSTSNLKSFVLRLGGLHTQMSFLGCVGHLMAGSGLQEILEVIYADNAVKHILSGKAISRGIRGHLLIDAALNTMLVANTFNLPLPTPSDENDPDEPDATEGETTLDPDLIEAGDLYDGIMADPSIGEAVSMSDALQRIKDKLDSEKETMQILRTAKLWLQYMDMISILRMFIKAERTGNWTLHLKCVQYMLPYFAASGHNLYAKSAYIYLQMMHQLEDRHPSVHASFLDGLHVIRRSHRYWAGLSSDLIIEQVLMRSIKTSGGLTRGRGMTEIQRLVWLLSMPACADINCSMQELTQVNCDTSEQHKDTTCARLKRDTEDIHKILSTLRNLDPFGPEPSLHGLVSGVTASASVNVDNARDVGQKVLDSMVGKSVKDFSFQRKTQAVTLGSKTSVKIDNVTVQIDPQVLFQRLSLIATNGSQDDPASVFKYELCTHPPALFDRSARPLEPNKPALADALWKLVEKSQDGTKSFEAGDVHYVLDGGALVQRLPWTQGYPFERICKMYVDYVTSKYGKATIVFDGYECGPTIKDSTHQRRGQGTGPTLVLTPQTVVTIKKKYILSNNANKQKFISLLSNSLEKAGCNTIHAQGDADVLIVQTAVESAKSRDTVLVGDDTDLLVLLLYHVDSAGHDIYFKPEPKKDAKKIRTWDIKRAKETLGPDIYTNVLFVHALLGCDTTSRVYGIGKGVALDKVKRGKFIGIAEVFKQDNATQDEIIKAGERALVSLYKGNANDDLDSLRYKRFREKVATSNSYVEANSLPPTSATARYHSLRVFFQVQEWKGNAGHMKPEEWGWKNIEDALVPLKTDQPPAPDELLRLFRCNCKTGCSTDRCTCKKHRLDCTYACGDCKGLSCSNSPRPVLDNENLDE